MTTTDNEIPTRFMFAVREDGSFIDDAESGETLWKFAPDILTGRTEISPAKGILCAEWLNGLATQPQAARWIIHEWDGDNELGHSAGSFYTEMLKVCALADQNNLRSLRLGFPALVGAVSIWQNVTGSPELLREFLRKEWWVPKVPA